MAGRTEMTIIIVISIWLGQSVDVPRGFGHSWRRFGMRTLREFVSGFGFVLFMAFIWVPAWLVSIVLLIGYICVAAAVGALAGLLLYGAPFGLPQGISVALAILCGLVVTLFGWYLEYWVNDKTGFPFGLQETIFQ